MPGSSKSYATEVNLMENAVNLMGILWVGGPRIRGFCVVPT